MSLDEFHRRAQEALQTKAQAAINKANNVRPRYASPGTAASTTDEIAMFTIEALSEVRAYLDAEKTITNIYRQIVQPTQTTTENLVEDQKPKMKRVYG